MPVGCYKQMSAMKQGAIIRLQCNYISVITNQAYIYIS